MCRTAVFRALVRKGTADAFDTLFFLTDDIGNCGKQNKDQKDNRNNRSCIHDIYPPFDEDFIAAELLIFDGDCIAHQSVILLVYQSIQQQLPSQVLRLIPE